MKKLICLILILFSSTIYAADTKLTALDELTTVADADWIYIVDVTDTTAKKMTVLNLFDTIDTSAELLAILTNETGTGALVFATSPTLVTPILGTITSGVGTALTALNGENIQDDTIDDDSIDFGDITGVDFTLTDCGAITSTGTITATVGFDIVGAADIDYGSVDVTDHTFVTDSTGDGEIVLPNDSIGDAEIDWSGLTTSADFTVTGTLFTSVGIDAVGAVDMDYGSADVTDHTFTTDDMTFIMDGGITVSTGDFIKIGTTQWNSADEMDGTKIKDADYGDVVIDAAGDWNVVNAETITITDNESTAENNPLVFVAGADPDGGDLGLETDGDAHYNPSTGTITATEFVGGGAGITGLSVTYENIGDPAAAGSISFDDTETATYSTAQNTAGSFMTIDNTVADVTNNVYLLDLDYSVDDNQANADYFKCQDAGGVVFTIQQNGDTASTGTIEGATITEGGNAVWNATETDILDSGHYIAGSIDAEHLAADIVDETKIADNGIDSEHYNDGSIDLVHLAAGVYAKDIVTTSPITGGTDNVLVGADGDVTLALDFTASWDFGGAAGFELPNAAAPTTDAAGEIALDTTITDHQPLWQYYDGGENMTLIGIDTAQLPAEDNEIVKYDAASDKFVLEADASGGTTAWDDIGDPDAAATVDFTTHTQTIDIGKSDSGGGSGLVLDVTGLGVGTDDVVALLITTATDEDTDYIPIEIRQDSGATNDLLFSVDNLGEVYLYSDLTFRNVQEISGKINNYLSFQENGDTIHFYYGGTDLGIVWTDGALNLRNAEDGIDAIVEIEGKDDGEKGILRVLSDGDDKHIELHHDDTDGHIITNTGDIHIEPAGGDTVFTGGGDFGGADLELPQASPAVPDADGEVEVDFTDGKVVIQHGSAHAELAASTDVVVGTLIKSWSGTIFEPDGVNDVMTVKAINSIEFPHGVVITAIYLGVSEDSNYTLTFQNFDDFDTINGANPTIDAVAYTADTTGEVIDTTPTYATIAAGQIIMMSIPATNVDWIHFEIYYYEPAA